MNIYAFRHFTELSWFFSNKPPNRRVGRVYDGWSGTLALI